MRQERPSGRGRLSSLDLIPDEGRDDVLWALEELNKRERTQADILFELNDRLEAKGIEGISKSAFNRKAVRVSAAARRISEARAVFAGIADQFTPGEADANNFALGEVIKTLILELLDEPGHSPKGAMELARAFLATIQAQNLSTARKLKLEAEMKAQAAKAIDQVAGEKGITRETAEAIKAQILGIRAK